MKYKVEMIDRIEQSYIRNDTPLPPQMIDIITFLGGNMELTDCTNDILKAVGSFLEAVIEASDTLSLVPGTTSTKSTFYRVRDTDKEQYRH